jgi:hypothetical protein
MLGQHPGRTFISYSRKDDGAKFAADLPKTLEKENRSVWQDIVALEGGRDALLLNPASLKAKLDATGTPSALVADYEEYGTGEAQNLIGRTLRGARKKAWPCSPDSGCTGGSIDISVSVPLGALRIEFHLPYPLSMSRQGAPVPRMPPDRRLVRDFLSSHSLPNRDLWEEFNDRDRS